MANSFRKREQTLQLHSRKRPFIPDINDPYREETSSEITGVTMSLYFMWSVPPPSGSD